MCISVREATDADHDWIADLLEIHWGSPSVVSRGRIHQADRLPAFIAMKDAEDVGLLTYSMEGDELEVITLNVLVKRCGIGRRLLEAARSAAAVADCRRVWLITTNDNAPAIGFYKHLGFSLVAVHEGAIRESRRLKPEIPETGVDGVPIRDELEFEVSVHPAGG
jgi:N-acetylglutamate synthase-like GNAT family acetyltransferase